MPLVLPQSLDTFGAPEKAQADSDVALSIEKMRRAVEEDPYPTLDARRALLRQLRELINDNAAALIDAASQDLGRTERTDTEWFDLAPVTAALRHSMGHVGRWMRPVREPVDPVFRPGRRETIHRPCGIVGIASQARSPLQSALGPIIASLAAGNRVVLAPAPGAPATASLLEKLVPAFFDTAELVVPGPAGDAPPLHTLPLDHFVLPSERTAIGGAPRPVDDDAQITWLSDGPAAVLLGEDASPADIASLIVGAKFLVTGQWAYRPDFLLVPRAQVRTAAGEILRVLNDLDEQSEETPPIPPPLDPRREILLKDAENRGAEVYRPRRSRKATGGPTLILNAPPGAMIHQSDDLGPLLPIVAYDTLEAGLDIIKNSGSPSMLYCFTRDREAQRIVRAQYVSGALVFNGLSPVSSPDLLDGEAGFRTLTRPHRIAHDSVVSAGRQVAPPWSDIKRLAAGWLRRR